MIVSSDIGLLAVTAGSIGFIHTLIGPDHYIPFIMMKRALHWSMLKTLRITLLCGLGHVLSSVVLGMIGVLFGIVLSRLEVIESFRGELAAWALIAFGLAYGIWGVRRAIRSKRHAHAHAHDDGTLHHHEHTHTDGHTHVHEAPPGSTLTAWTLFVVFILGPCEPLIPLVMYPAARHQSMIGVTVVTLVFGVATLSTMLAMVFLMSRGLTMIRTPVLERYIHALAGGVIAVSGLTIKFLGL